MMSLISGDSNSGSPLLVQIFVNILNYYFEDDFLGRFCHTL